MGRRRRELDLDSYHHHRALLAEQHGEAFPLRALVAAVAADMGIEEPLAERLIREHLGTVEDSAGEWFIETARAEHAARKVRSDAESKRLPEPKPPAGVASFEDHRNRRDADKHRRCQTAALLKLFRQANGRDPRDTAELAAWLPANVSGPIDPYAVLTAEEIAAAAEKGN